MKTTLRINGGLLDLSSPVVMAIVNSTPDSFYAGAREDSDVKIRAAVGRAIEAGAAMIDVGGYSSRPGAADVSPSEETRRVVAAVKIIRGMAPDMPVSIDTFRAAVAESVMEQAGACIVNDISAGDLDGDMIPTVAALGVPYIAMHMKGTPRDMQQHCEYGDVTAEVVEYFSRKLDTLQKAGVADIVLDPGFGFAKNVEQNFELLSRLSDLRIFGLPVLAGVSRKTMIWKTLGITPCEALNGTTALNWECLRQGANILRVHDVKEAVETVRLYERYKR